MDFQTIGLSIVGAGGGGAAIAYLVFQTFGAKWLDSQFSGRLQALKHDHAQQMAHLKLKIDGQLDRAVKLNQREFDVVPTIWKAVTEAHYGIMDTIAIMQSYPDLNRMTEEEFEEFLSGTRLQEFQKIEIRRMNGWDRTSYYGDKMQWIKLNDANKLLTAFNYAFLTNSIFLHPDTFAEFERFAKPLRAAFHRWHVNMKMGDAYRLSPEGEPDPVDAFRSQGADLYEALARFLREHFYGLAKIGT